MITLKFKNEDQANAVVGVIEYSLKLIEPKEIKKISKEMYEYALNLKQDLVYQQDNEVLYIKDDEVSFLFDNAIWILTQEIKKKPNTIYSNSIGLMKQILDLIKSKNKDRFTIKDGRKFIPELLEFYNQNKNKEFLIKEDFKIEFSIDMPKGLVFPKEQEVWIVIDYNPYNGPQEEEAIEDTLLLINKLTNKKCELPVSEFDKISELII